MGRGQRCPRAYALAALGFLSVSQVVAGQISMSGGASAGAQRAVSAAAKGKRRSFRSVQEAREKLTYKSGAKPEFEYELLLMFVRNELSAAVTTPLLAVIVAMGAMFWAPPRELLLWLGTVFVSKGILISLCRQFIKAPREDANTPVWRAKITAAEFLYGVTWAAVAFISPDTPGRGGQHLHLRLAAGRHLDAHAVRLDGDADRLCRHPADDRPPSSSASPCSTIHSTGRWRPWPSACTSISSG